MELFVSFLSIKLFQLIILCVVFSVCVFVLFVCLFVLNNMGVVSSGSGGEAGTRARDFQSWPATSQDSFFGVRVFPMLLIKHKVINKFNFRVDCFNYIKFHFFKRLLPTPPHFLWNEIEWQIKSTKRIIRYKKFILTLLSKFSKESANRI